MKRAMCHFLHLVNQRRPAISEQIPPTCLLYLMQNSAFDLQLTRADAPDRFTPLIQTRATESAYK